MTDCKGYAVTGCREGSHGYGCPLADPLPYHSTVTADGRLFVPGSPGDVMVSGRRSGKTYAADKQRAMWLMADEVVVVGEKRSGHRVWVCPVCWRGDGGWQVEVWNGLFPTLLDQELKTVAMIHLLEEWETHSEWCLDYLEMSRTDGEDAR